MTIRIQRLLYPLAALTLAATLLYFYTSGRLVKYLAPAFLPMCLVAGLLLLVLALFVLISCREEASCGHDHGDGDEANHEASEMHPMVTVLLMVVPLALAVMWTKDSFSLATIERKSLYDAPLSKNVFLASDLPPLTLDEIKKTHRKNAEGDYQFNLMELYFAIGDPEMISLVDGMKVETEGRLVTEKVNNENGTRKRLYRLFITCCAADARAVPIVAEFGKTPPDIAENEWVKVTGEIRFPNENGAIQAVLQVNACEKSEPPWEESFMRNH